jgi:hypothetical protein
MFAGRVSRGIELSLRMLLVFVDEECRLKSCCLSRSVIYYAISSKLVRCSFWSSFLRVRRFVCVNVSRSYPIVYVVSGALIRRFDQLWVRPLFSFWIASFSVQPHSLDSFSPLKFQKTPLSLLRRYGRYEPLEWWLTSSRCAQTSP